MKPWLGAAALSAFVALTVRAEAPRDAPREAPRGGLGSFAPALEGTWELVALRLPGGQVMRPPAATGVLVIDGGSILSASYVQDASGRKVGTLWEGRLLVDAERFRVEPRLGMRHDSAADPQNVEAVPRPSEGRVTVNGSDVVFERTDGGRVTWSAKEQRRVQVETDGTRIEHRRTSLVPRVPEGLPGR